MNRIEGLLKAYEAFVKQPWPRRLSGAERVWFAVYEPSQERRLLLRLQKFETVTKRAGHGWLQVDVSGLFAEWMGNHRYREAYFDDPKAMDLALQDVAQHVADRVVAMLSAPDADENTVVVLSGVGSLFGLVRTSDVIKRVAPAIRGRLLVFFPGHYEKAQYRLFDARDGWDYLAVPIIAKNEE